jgi:hypothetical protein
MNIKQILDRGVQETQYNDESYSYTGVRDFKEEKPEILKMGPKGPNLKPRTVASKNNSYS